MQFSAGFVILCEISCSCSHHPGATRNSYGDGNRTHVDKFMRLAEEPALSPPYWAPIRGFTVYLRIFHRMYVLHVSAYCQRLSAVPDPASMLKAANVLSFQNISSLTASTARNHLYAQSVTVRRVLTKNNLGQRAKSNCICGTDMRSCTALALRRNAAFACCRLPDAGRVICILKPKSELHRF